MQLCQFVKLEQPVKVTILNENTNEILRKDGLHHDLIMDRLSDEFVQAVASRRNHIPQKSLNYQTSLEAFVNRITDEQLKISYLI